MQRWPAKNRIARTAFSLAAFAASLSVHAAAADEVRLHTGDVLHGHIAEQDDAHIVLIHPLLGRLSLPRTQIESIVISSPDPAATPPAATPPAATPPAATPPAANPAPAQSPATPAVPGAAPSVAVPAPSPQTIPATPATADAQPPAAIPPAPNKPFWEGWKGTIDVGINGADGNTETFSGRAALGAKRITEKLETAATFQYIYVTDNGAKSQSRGELNLRNDWLLHPSPWGFFALGKLEYDEFQPWTLRGSAFVGPSYTFIQSDKTTLRGRTGLGLTREFGNDRNELSPEALFGLELDHKLSSRSRVYASTEILPSLADFPEHRINSQAGYELLVDPETHLNLKFGVAHRYNSDPGEDNGVRPKSNDIEYFITVGWTF